MRKGLLFLSCLSIVGVIGQAAPTCAAGTYASYQTLGAGGCTDGSVTFSNFSIPDFTNIGIADLSTSQIEVTPGGTALDPTLTFSYIGATPGTSSVTVNQSGQIFSMGVTYDLSIASATLSAIQMNAMFTNSSPGSISATKQAQLMSGGTTFTSTVSDQGVSNPLATYSGAVTSVTGTGTWVISDATSLQAQMGGSATEDNFENLFTLTSSSSGGTTPETVPALVVGIGLIGLSFISRQRRKSA